MKNTMKKFLSLLLVVLMCISCFVMPAEAATFNDINQSAIFVKQQAGDTCTLAAAVMMVRRTALASGNTNWSSITEASMKSTAWAPGLYYNFTYAGVSVGHSTISSNRKGNYINLLKTYPQGVVAWNSSQPHAVLLTDYDANTDTFYCADPANGTASGRIPLASSSINGSGQDGKINNLDHYWYVKSPSITLTSSEPTKIVYPTNGGIYKIASGVGNNMYLDFACSSDNVQIYENCDGHSNPDFVKSQYFKLTHVGDGWYTVVNVGNGKAMDVDNWTPDPTTNVHQYDLHSGDNQLFRFYDAGNGYCYIKSKLGCYLDVQNGDSVNNTNVWMYTFNESTAQKWKLEKKDMPSFDTQKPSITNVKISDVSSTGYTVTCNVSDNVGVARVAFPTWTTSNGQDDLMWKDGTTSGNTATFRVNTSDHKNEIGEYVTDIYAYDAAGNHGYTGSFVVVVPEPDTQKPSISNVRVTDINESGFTISCEVYDNVEIKQVLFPVWTTESLSSTSRPEAGQDDIVYHEATINGNTATCRINIADHNNSYGEYVCDPHVYDTSDNCLISSRIYIQVPKIVAKNEQLAPLGVYNLSENNTIGISGWAFNLTGERVDCYYQFDNDEETKFENANRPDVCEFHEGCKQIDCGYGGNISILDLSEGKHTVRIIAKTGNASQILFSNEFTVIVPTFTIYFNANSGQCSTASKSVKFNSSYGSLPTPTRNGHTFDGWYTSAIDGTKVTSSTKVTTTGDLTLYAHWTCNHSTTEIRNNVTATCTAEGYTGDTYCKACGTKIKAGDIIVKTPHNSNITIPAVSATCTKTGLTEGKKCSVCGIVTVAQTTVSKLSHTYTSKITTQATHLTEGIKTFTCKCGDSYTEPVAKLPEHTYTSELTKEATHLEEGETTYTCACGDSYTEVIEKLEAHTYTTEVTKEATHLEEGETTYTCACGDSYTEAIEKLEAHTYTTGVTKEATHLEEGEITYTCACGDSYTEVIEKLEAHTYTTEVTKEATHLEEGETTFTCACGDTYTEAIAKTKEHSYFVQNIVEPTCESEGYTTYMCECGHNYNGDKKAATGHNYNGDKCADCGESKIENYCSCNCHKSGFMGFIWKILRFFYKLFGTNKTCDCGVTHY